MLVRNWERFLWFFGGEREFSVRAKDLMRSVILEDLGSILSLRDECRLCRRRLAGGGMP